MWDSSTPPDERECAERWFEPQEMTTVAHCPASMACTARATYM
ncbi:MULTISPECIES: hypothetical protein [Actinomadura]|uniref:Uncharacterized protein n=1 Tax=Actinomadura yumaensis TaxID=111807 RepID=A0ABW2CDX3_9ACTN|nr:hypothetical protein [Actinomadura sp. J1-007]